MAEQRTDTIEAVEEILGSLRIIENNKSNQSIEPAIPEMEEMLTVSVLVIHNENRPTKNIVPDPE